MEYIYYNIIELKKNYGSNQTSVLYELCIALLKTNLRVQSTRPIAGIKKEINICKL